MTPKSPAKSALKARERIGGSSEHGAQAVISFAGRIPVSSGSRRRGKVELWAVTVGSRRAAFAETTAVDVEIAEERGETASAPEVPLMLPAPRPASLEHLFQGVNGERLSG